MRALIKPCPTGALIISAVLAFPALESSAQPPSQLPTSMEIRATDWNVRRNAFARLMGLDPANYVGGIVSIGDVARNVLATQSDAEERRRALVELLDIENAVTADANRRARERPGGLPPAERTPEAYFYYYGDLIAAVSAVSDERSLQALVGAITTGSPVMGSVLAFGTTAVGPIADLVESSPDDLTRAVAASALSRLLTEYRAVAEDSASRERIKIALLGAASHESSNVRMSAVTGLVALGDDESIAAVERLAAQDPYRADYRPGQPYVVREAAARALSAR